MERRKGHRAVCIAHAHAVDSQQQSELTESVASDGYQWWPMMFVQGFGWLWPGWCPGLAWANSRPWMVHISRIAEVDVPSSVYMWPADFLVQDMWSDFGPGPHDRRA